MSHDRDSKARAPHCPTVLVIEPSGVLKRTYRERVEVHGLQFVDCSTVVEALEIVCECKPSAILTANELPGLSGASLVAALRSSSLFRAIPIALITSAGTVTREMQFYSPDITLTKDATLSGQIDDFLESCWLTGHSISSGDLLRGRRVLVAEDSSVNRVFVGRLLHVLGADVELVGDGVEALEAVRRSRFDLVLMDIEMPRMDGREAALRLSALRPELPLIALSGHAAELTSSLTGIWSSLEKPVSREGLLGACSRLLSAA